MLCFRIFVFFNLLLVSALFAHPILENRIPKDNFRHSTFSRALNLLEEREAKVIVETGTSRYGASNCLGDGCSTILFGDWAHNNRAILYSVDIDPVAIGCASTVVEGFQEAVIFEESDSVAFLANFGRKIDFLYLDSFDYEINDPIPSQVHHLREIEAAFPWLSESSVVMIDDCDLPGEGKGKLAIRFLLERGWEILEKSFQVILVHP